MPRFAANLSMLNTEVPFLDRFAAAAADGFDAVKYLFPFDFTAAEIAARLKDNGLTQALFNLTPGDWAAGGRGLACHPGREEEFARDVATALAYARTNGCQRLHAMAGLKPAGVSEAALRATYVSNLRAAAAQLAPHNITLLSGPINTRYMPDYFLNWQQQAHDIVAEVGAPNLQVQMDFHHCQIIERDLTRRLEQHIAGIGHIQIADVPDRHEPDGGEVHYPPLLDRLDALGYGGFVGCEYRPKAGASKGLGWLRRYQASRKASA